MTTTLMIDPSAIFRSNIPATRTIILEFLGAEIQQHLDEGDCLGCMTLDTIIRKAAMNRNVVICPGEAAVALNMLLAEGRITSELFGSVNGEVMAYSIDEAHYGDYGYVLDGKGGWVLF
jgi:hypothetical protein